MITTTYDPQVAARREILAKLRKLTPAQENLLRRLGHETRHRAEHPRPSQGSLAGRIAIPIEGSDRRPSSALCLLGWVVVDRHFRGLVALTPAGEAAFAALIGEVSP